MAAPRMMPIAPSVTMNGITRRPVMSSAVERGRTAPPPARRRAPPQTGATPACSRHAIDDGGERHDRADRQVDAAEDHDHRHAQGGDADDGRLADHRAQVAGGGERVGHQRREDDVEDERARPAARPSCCGRATARWRGASVWSCLSDGLHQHGVFGQLATPAARRPAARGASRPRDRRRRAARAGSSTRSGSPCPRARARR